MGAASGTGPSRAAVRAVAIVVAAAIVLSLLATGFAVSGRLQPTDSVASRLAPGTAEVAPSATPGVGGTPRAGVVPTAPPAAAATPGGGCPTPAASSATGVRVGLARTFAVGAVISFGLPLPPGALADPATLRVAIGGTPIPATVRTLLRSYNADGAATGLRAVQVQLPASALRGDCAEAEITWRGSTVAPAGAPAAQPYAAVSAPSPKTVTIATRTIRSQNGRATLVETERKERTIYTGREPTTLATFPPGYLAATGILGPQVAAGQIGPDLAGLKFISDQVTPFGLSGMFQEGYALNPDAVVGPEDLDEKAEKFGYEGWLYDRCATYLLFAAHTGDTRFLREGLRACAYYASKIALQGENRGIFTVTPEPDDKFSHLRGLYAYYALTGDEAALAAGEAIADLWLNDPYVITPYRAGKLRGPDKLWTERQLGVGLEGLIYGHLLTGKADYLRATAELVATAYRHVTGDAAALAAINPGVGPFPPQNCLIHSAEQHSEGDADQPWCSGWMPALMIDALLAYQAQTNDPRVDEIFIRLTRFLRDTGSAYFRGDVLQDSFLTPSVRFDPNEEDPRILVPLYGSGIDGRGKRQNYGEYDDYQHCLDASALTAAGLRALKRTGTYDQRPIGPFRSEGESFLALHQELAFCASYAFRDQTRLARDPATLSSEYLAEGLRDPAKFIRDNDIGYPSRNVSPQRKLGWWFNPALAQFALLAEVGIAVPELRPGAIQK